MKKQIWEGGSKPEKLLFLFSASDLWGFPFCFLTPQPEERRQYGRMETLSSYQVSDGGRGSGS